MKAFLLAAGKGTRLRPLTDDVPKCLVPIDGQPLLGLWFDMLAKHGVDSVLVNTHHLHRDVEGFVRENRSPHLTVTLAYEPRLLGSAGTVSRNRDFVADEESFLIIYADNLTDLDLAAMCRQHHDKSSLFTMALFTSSFPSECGIAVCNESGLITEFEEKPQDPKSSWANAGVYVAGSRVFDSIPAEVPCDFGFDVLPSLVGKMYGFCWEGFYCDIGTPERLALARAQWPRRLSGGKEC